MKDGHFTKCFLWAETSELLSNPHSVQRRIHHKVAVRTLLEVNRVKKYYGRDSFLAKLFGREPTLVKAVDDVSFEVGTVEIFALVGESGCGKTTLARCLIKLLDLTEGRIKYFYGQGEQDVERSEKNLRQSVQMIPNIRILP